MATVVTSNVYSSASYTLRISVNANGGGTVPSQVQKSKSSSGSTCVVPCDISSTVPTRSGYRFLGYAKTATGGVTYQPGDTIKNTFTRSATFDHSSSYYNSGVVYTTNYYTSSNKAKTITIYCVWEAVTYTVTYNAGGGTGAPESQTKYQDVTLTLSSKTPTWAGHAFSKWNTKAAGTGTNYSPGGSYTANANATLYAIWTTNTYAVTYNANGGSGAPAAQTKVYGTALTLSSTKPTRSGYNFVKWNTKSDGTGTSYNPGASYTANAALTLYAIWTVSSYTITYNANGHGTAPAKQTKNAGSSVTLAAAITITGSVMTEWNTKANGTGTSYSPGGTYSADANVTLYAIWTEATYTVTFDADGGSVSPATKTVTWGHKYGELPVPTKSGETFYGWFLVDLLVTANSEVELTADATLTAAWTPRSQMRVKGSDNALHVGALYVKGSDGNMHMAVAYVKGSDGQMHING